MSYLRSNYLIINLMLMSVLRYHGDVTMYVPGRSLFHHKSGVKLTCVPYCSPSACRPWCEVGGQPQSTKQLSTISKAELILMVTMKIIFLIKGHFHCFCSRLPTLVIKSSYNQVQSISNFISRIEYQCCLQ